MCIHITIDIYIQALFTWKIAMLIKSQFDKSSFELMSSAVQRLLNVSIA